MHKRVAVALCLIGVALGGYNLAAVAGEKDPDPSSIIESHLKAMGGREAIAAIHDKTTKGTMTISGLSPAPLTGTITIQQKSMNMIHQYIDLGMAQTENWFDGEKGYHVDPLKGPGPYSDTEIDEAKQVFVMSPFLNYKERGLKASYEGKDTVNGKETLVVKLRDPKGIINTFYFDASTYYLVKLIAPLPAAEGTGEQSVLLSDYREVGGLKHAFKTVRSSPAMTIEVTVDSIQMNTGLDDSVFRHKE
jgi:outer membrane lipoprotein-sorting protein